MLRLVFLTVRSVTLCFIPRAGSFDVAKSVLNSHYLSDLYQDIQELQENLCFLQYADD